MHDLTSKGEQTLHQFGHDYGNEERIKLRKDGKNRLDGMATG